MTRVAAPVLSLTFKITPLGPGHLGLRLRSDPETSEARLYHAAVLAPSPAVHDNRYLLHAPDRVLSDQPHRSARSQYSAGSAAPSKWLLSYGYRFERQRGFVPDPSAPCYSGRCVGSARDIYDLA